ncbi:hypothetical protein OIB37_21775 [Streptomyces sp. NBC_00820]|uniref:hypothetical protein n=1 Tax=Streptomyces sp. NBC_00820 TaxID=2975842 RepID=UPI002ED5792B|nr:hypothetical protein OIB37_21775 [Streptomyces sp. NBC_00820]
MKSTTVRRLTLSTALVAALAGVAACGTPDTGKGDKAAGKSAIHMSPVAALRSVEKSTDKAESARVRSTMTMGTLATMSADGVMSWGDGLKGDLTINYTGGKLGEAMRKAGTSSMEARYLPDAYYAKMSDAFAKQSGGKHWVRYAYADLAKLTGGSGAYVQDQARNNTPNQSVKMLLASGDVKKVGEEKVSGATATHYSGTVDVADLVGKNSSLGADQLADLKKQLDKAGITTETVDIWIDGRDLLVKKTETADTANGRLVTTATYSDYGVKADAEVPPAGDTKDFKDLLRSSGLPGGGKTSSGASAAS